ncbi:rubredoxin [Stenotrophomonas maltophilia]|uniref:rubredoxin n=1 Tax=Stenotrophomonas maltophilia TaxID=40324 RepID=UPI0024185FC3|nr:rubredoxin [Stenotrophomonas maltophilia]
MAARESSPDYPMSNATPTTLRTWMCVVCGFLYSEAEGLPEEGIAPGTRWEDIPETWTCPDCGVTKADFEMVEVD